MKFEVTFHYSWPVSFETMKKALLISCIVIVGSVSVLFSQEYYQLLKEGRYWVYTKMGQHDPPIYILRAFALTPDGDSLLNGNTYKKIYRLTLELNSNTTAIKVPRHVLQRDLYALMREDTIERKVYLLPFDDLESMCQDDEHLLYDFSLQQGDTLNDCVLANLYIEGQKGTPVVDTIWESNYQGLNTRFFETEGFFDNYGDLCYCHGYILEGFGYEMHGLVNYGRNGGYFIFQYFCESGDPECDFLSSSSEIPLIPADAITVSPNPAVDFITIQAAPNYTIPVILDCSIVTATGTTVMHDQWNTNEIRSLDVRGIPHGVYFIYINGSEGRLVKKLMITH